MTTEETLRKMYHVACDRADALNTQVAEIQTAVAFWKDAADKNGRLYSGAENQRDDARAELAETRRIVAEWLYGANSGWDSDPGSLQNVFERSGRTLSPEFDVIERDEEAT